MINVDDHQVEVPLQVEINTIASSFGCLSKKVGDFHRFMLQRSADSEAYQNLMIKTGGGDFSQVRRVFNAVYKLNSAEL
jgi:Eukaryotic glutathione synthase, ATP binding domain